MVIVFYVSGHGLGHATRDIEVMRALLARERDARIVVRTSAPRWIFERTAPPSVELQDADIDPGVVERSDLSIDEAATVREAARFYDDFDDRTAAEAAVLHALAADFLVGDIPPLAFAAAARLGIPSVALGNFTWDWIYASDRPLADAPLIIQTIRRAYAAATRTFRLPLHGDFDAMTPVVDVPFIARRSTRDRGETRTRLGIVDDRPAVLLSFDRMGLDMPARGASDAFTVVDTSVAAMEAHGLAYQDLVAAVDVVISKPGYGIASECLANGAALLYTSREGFIESDMLAVEMPRVLRCRFLPRADLEAGRWSDAIAAVLRQPVPGERPRVDGADVVAQSLIVLHDCTRHLR